jgi:hypothetical protein
MQALHTADNDETKRTIEHFIRRGYTFGTLVNGRFISLQYRPREKLKQVGQRLFIEIPQREDEFISHRMKKLHKLETIRWINHLYCRAPTGETYFIKDEVVSRHRDVRWAS